nr:transcription factor MYB58-like [Tanacetum cinerariifolium]
MKNLMHLIFCLGGKEDNLNFPFYRLWLRDFAPQEEHSIIRLYATFGNKWSKIVSHLLGRKDNEIKNAWNTFLKRRSLQRLSMPAIDTTDDIPDSSSSNISYSDQNIYNEEPTNQEISSSHDQQLTAVAEYPKAIEVAAIGPISVDDIIQKPLAPFTLTLSIINSTQEYKACSSCYDINPTCYNDKIINNIDIKFPDNLVSYSEDELCNMVESPRLISLDHDHDDVNYESWKSGHETMEGAEDYSMGSEDYEGPLVFDDDQYEKELMPVYDTTIKDVIEEEEEFVTKGGFDRKEDNIEDVVVRLLDDELGLHHEKDSLANTSQQIDQNHYQTIMSKLDQEEPEIWEPKAQKRTVEDIALATKVSHRRTRRESTSDQTHSQGRVVYKTSPEQKERRKIVIYLLQRVENKNLPDIFIPSTLTQEYKACSNSYDVNPTCYNDKIINNTDIEFPGNLVSYSEDELWNMVESPRPISLDHDHHDVKYESWKLSCHETMEGVEYWVRLLEDELGLDHENDSIANTSQQIDQNQYQTIMTS